MIRCKHTLSLSLSAIAALSGCDADDPEETDPTRLFTDVARHPPAFAPGEVILKFSDAAADRPERVELDGFHARWVEDLAFGAELWEVSLDGADDDEQGTLDGIVALKRRLDLEYAHENLRLQLSATPNDPHYAKQWNFASTRFPAAWDRVKGGVKVAVLDSGRLDHPDMAGRWGEGFDFGNGDPDPRDTGRWHHGLHVAGILGAKTNSGLGVAGGTWTGPILPVRVAKDDDGVNLSAVGNAISWSIGKNVRVINMSFGSLVGMNKTCADYPYIQNAVTAAVQAGVVVVAAAGNENGDTAKVVPASCTGVIAVAASTPSGTRAPWSNKGSRVDITAPGGTTSNQSNSLYGAGIGCPADGTPYAGTDGVLSTWATYKPGAQLTSADYCYRYLSGTSMAAPHVAAAAALILTLNPALSPAQVTARLKAAADPIPGCASGCGAGLLDVAGALPPNPQLCDPGACAPGHDCHCDDVCRPAGSLCP
jgi:subtilisin family serine protease